MPKQKSSQNTIHAVLFDMGKVLIHFDFTPAFKRLARHAKTSPQKVSRFFHDSGLEVLYDGGKISSKTFYEEVRRGLGLSIDFEAFQNIWNGVFKPIPPMIRLLKRLHGKKRLVLISNTNAMHYAYVRKKYLFLEIFDGHVLSFKEKIRKPDPQIYRKALMHCKTKPQAVFYIDDRADLTEAAREMGFHTHTYQDNHEALVSKLKKLGVL